MSDAIDQFWQAIQRDAAINAGAARLVHGLAVGAFIITPCVDDGRVASFSISVAPAYKATFDYLRTLVREARPGHQRRRKRAWRMR